MTAHVAATACTSALPWFEPHCWIDQTKAVSGFRPTAAKSASLALLAMHLLTCFSLYAQVEEGRQPQPVAVFTQASHQKKWSVFAQTGACLSMSVILCLVLAEHTCSRQM